MRVNRGRDTNRPNTDLTTDFGRFYEEHAKRVLAYLARRCLDPEVAVDLMAETFAVAFADRDNCRARTSAEGSGWLFAIAKSQLADYFRRGSAELKAVRRLGLSVPELDEDDFARVDELADLDEVRATIAERFELLPADQRTAVRLRVIEELPYPAVAGRLQISENAARARVSRGLRQLSGLLDGPSLAREGASQ
jgi:RNA polymerase sigma-70 factor (ECF subfamily)